MKTPLFLLFLSACGNAFAPPYDNNDLELLTGYRAKELCSCLFVMQMDRDFCAEYTVASPNLATFQIDLVDKSVTTEALFMWGARAHLWRDADGNLSERFGCIIDR